MIKKDLNGLWDFMVDLDPKYHNNPVIHPVTPYAQPDFNRRNWLKVPVPGVWNKYAEKLDIYEGVCWFVREFIVEALTQGFTAFLRFGAVNYRCRIFLNSQEVGTHEGGYTEFVVDVSGALKEGENVLAVEVDNRAVVTKLPPVLGYFNYGGIHRDVTLEIYSGAFLEDVTLTTRQEVLCVTCTIRHREPDLQLKITCHGVESVVTPTGEEISKVQVRVPGVSPWTPDSPTLYPATVQLLRGSKVLHEVSYRIGFRTIEMADGKILLNGQSIFLKGICYVYDSPVYGLTMKPEQFETDLALLKELGVNTIRGHFPFTREFYEACDRVGIMIWNETPVYCLHPKDDATNTIFSDPEFIDLARSMVREMIRHARNHPSVIVYSLGNECNVENKEAEGFFKVLCETVRTLDPTRLISYASLYCIVGPLAGLVDILGINQYWGWYDREYWAKEPPALNGPIDLKVLEEKLDELKSLHKKPMLMTEFGGDSIPGYIAESRNLWSEDYHAELLKATFTVLEKHPEIRGTFPFCFTDYRDPSKHVNGYWDYMNYKGVVSYDRRPKKAFYALKSLYRKGQ
jgi:beta-glucuronidase